MDITAYSSLTKLLHISAYVLRFIFNSKQLNASHRKTGPLLPKELTEALQIWFHGCQQASFADEYTSLQSKGSKVRRLTLVRQLRLFLDEKGIIHCGGGYIMRPLAEELNFHHCYQKNTH